ncbi:MULTISPECIES: heavy-metal-associated domain-containing protein [unclassified Psychrobacter]|uniref:heavy-metal-associated domain-containing protein n=1 Tax=unclassified Psychrobacter TaxID=196806 RepID=UPI0018F65192|nr:MULTISPECIES: cation transporter [unclassified Psychrobacter]
MSDQTRIIHIDGMTCGGCVASVHTATADIDGLHTLTVELSDNQATATFDDAQTSAEAIAEAISDAGFDARVANA